jgi:uncharacterized OB-fold protein
MCFDSDVATGEATWTMELPYRRSLGPVVGGFLTGLRDGRVLGSRTTGGRVLVPPLEYDPDTGEAVESDLVEVGAAGTVVHAARVAEPRRKHPLDRPFTWALVRLDGADTSILHAVDGDVGPGDRVRIRWRDERVGHISDIECFEVET